MTDLASAAKKYDQALKDQELDILEEIVESDYIIHADAITLSDDLKGVAAAQNYWQAYFDKYTFEHEVLATAEDTNSGVAFVFWLDRNVTPKDESVFDEKLDSKDTLPSQTLGIFKHEFGSGGKIKSTWFLRQFSKDEAARKPVMDNGRPSSWHSLTALSAVMLLWTTKLKNAPDFSKVSVHAPSYREKADQQQGQEQKQLDATKAYSKIWSTGDPSSADSIMTDDVRFVDLLWAEETKGRKEFKAMIQSFFKDWHNEQDKRIDVAATSGNKTFVHWSSTGVEGKDGSRTTMYGLDVVVFDDDNTIKEVLVLRQPLESQKAELFGKEE